MILVNNQMPLIANSKPSTNLIGKNLAIESGITLAVSALALAILNPYTITSISHVLPSVASFLAKFEIWTMIVSNPVILGVVAGALALLAIALIVGIILAVKESNNLKKEPSIKSTQNDNEIKQTQVENNANPSDFNITRTRDLNNQEQVQTAIKNIDANVKFLNSAADSLLDKIAKIAKK
jgi:hypothetical protein